MTSTIKQKLAEWLVFLVFASLVIHLYLISEFGDFLFSLGSILFLVALIPVYLLSNRSSNSLCLILTLALINEGSDLIDVLFRFDIHFIIGGFTALIEVCLFYYFLIKVGFSKFPKWMLIVGVTLLSLYQIFNYYSYYQYEYVGGIVWSDSLVTIYTWGFLISQYVTLLGLLYGFWMKKEGGVTNRSFALTSGLVVIILVLIQIQLFSINSIKEWSHDYYEFNNCTACILLESHMNWLSFAFVLFSFGCLIYILVTKRDQGRIVKSLSIAIIIGFLLLALWHYDNDQKQLKEIAYLKEESRHEQVNAMEAAASAKEAEAHAIINRDKFKEAMKALQFIKDERVRYVEELKSSGEIFLSRKSGRSFNSIEEAVLFINLDYNDGPTLNLMEIKKDTVKIHVWDSDKLTQQMGTTGAQIYLAKVVYTLTEIKGIRYVDLSFEAGDHANPGTYSRQDFDLSVGF